MKKNLIIVLVLNVFFTNCSDENNKFNFKSFVKYGAGAFFIYITSSICLNELNNQLSRIIYPSKKLFDNKGSLKEVFLVLNNLRVDCMDFIIHNIKNKQIILLKDKQDDYDHDQMILASLIFEIIKLLNEKNEQEIQGIKKEWNDTHAEIQDILNTEIQDILNTEIQDILNTEIKNILNTEIKNILNTEIKNILKSKLDMQSLSNEKQQLEKIKQDLNTIKNEFNIIEILTSYHIEQFHNILQFKFKYVNLQEKLEKLNKIITCIIKTQQSEALNTENLSILEKIKREQGDTDTCKNKKIKSKQKELISLVTKKQLKRYLSDCYNIPIDNRYITDFVLEKITEEYQKENSFKKVLSKGEFFQKVTIKNEFIL